MKELFNSLRYGLAPEKAALPWLWDATNQLSLICYRRLTYFPFFYFLWLWEQDGEGRVESTDQPLFLGNKTKNKTPQVIHFQIFCFGILWLFFQ